jgi:hypothetical protein
MNPLMRILLAMPHFFDAGGSDTTNRSRRADAREERVHALVAAIAGAHQALGSATYGLDHEKRTSWQMASPAPHALDLVICTSGGAHLLAELAPLRLAFHHHATDADPMMLGFECHKVLRDARGRYDYVGYIEDDIVLLDPLFFRKRRLFDRHFGPGALLQPNRYEASATGPVHKLYVDYRLNPRVTAAYQNIAEEPRLDLPFLDGTVSFERTPYPSAGCFFLNDEQLDIWTRSKNFLDGDVSYMSPLDSAATLAIMKTFRIYKPVLDQAWFLEVLHASPRWISIAAGETRLVPARDISGGG